MPSYASNPLRGSYLSVDDIYTLLQLADMAVAALERKDFVQVDAALTRISNLRRKYESVRKLVGTLSKRRSLGPDMHLM